MNKGDPVFFESKGHKKVGFLSMQPSGKKELLPVVWIDND